MDIRAEDGLTTLRTARLTLRPLSQVSDADIDAIAEGLNDWDVVRWLTAVPFPYTRADAEWFVREGQAEGLNWAIDAGDGAIGVIGLMPDLGYWLSRNANGQGIMSESVRAVLDHVFAVGADHLVSGHFKGNAPSRAILTKMGFVDTHVEQAERRADGKIMQLQRMRLTADDWRARG